MAYRFKKFKVYQDAKVLHLNITEEINKFPLKYFYLADQIKRSSLSILLNIAEGSSRQSDKEFNRYISISLGSVDETAACLDIALCLNLISSDKHKILEEKCLSISNQLGGFSKLLKNQIKTKVRSY
jgi:four helix bundle protein